MSNQPIGPLGAKFPVTVILAATPVVLKYIEKDLQRIFKTIPEAQAPTNSEEPRDKHLKARFPDVYHEKFHMECFNFYQQCEDYFITVEARGANQIFFAMSFF